MSDSNDNNSNDNNEDTLLEFPCDYQLKVIGLDEGSFDELIFEIVSKHVDGLEMSALSSRNSNTGKYLSITVSITATSKRQLDNIYIELSAHKSVKMAL